MDEDGKHRPVTVPISMAETLTLRDQFAMAALGGINVKEFKPDEIAWLVYQVADSMLEARK
jgi:hypothetical protein